MNHDDPFLVTLLNTAPSLILPMQHTHLSPVANHHLHDPKKALRQEMRAILNRLSRETPIALQKLRDWLATHPQVKTISVYAALPGEVDITPLIPEYPHLRWLFPRVEGNNLILHHVTDHIEDLEAASFGILEPKTHLPTILLHQVDAFLCPGLAFDPQGGRLGRGRGFYDRLLENARPDAYKIGICHQEQIVPNTYPESHDVMMDAVIDG